MKSGRLWPIALVAVLVMTVAANALLLWAANDEQSLAFEPDYYRKALAWDSTAAAIARSAALGWTARGSIEPGDGRTGILSITLTDSLGQPVPDAALTATATPIAHGSRVASVALAGQEGIYRGSFPLVYQGLYEIRVEAVRGTDRFLASLRGQPGAGPLQP
ncbi:MAG TPA: FixH family protein [Gemmatimonadales bacterium]|nr:FixH family protein [Gemmatimonadales bacterium]